MKTHSIISETLTSFSDEEEQRTLDKVNQTVAHCIKEIQSRAQWKGQNKKKQPPSNGNARDMAVAMTKRQLDSNKSHCYRHRGICPVMKGLTHQPAR